MDFLNKALALVIFRNINKKVINKKEENKRKIFPQV